MSVVKYMTSSKARLGDSQNISGRGAEKRCPSKRDLISIWIKKVP